MPALGTTLRGPWLPTANMPTWEQSGRVIAGLLLAATMLSDAGLLAVLDGPARQVTAVVLALGAADLIVSGAIGWCPVYRYILMPWTPRSPR